MEGGGEDGVEEFGLFGGVEEQVEDEVDAGSEGVFGFVVAVGVEEMLRAEVLEVLEEENVFVLKDFFDLVEIFTC